MTPSRSRTLLALALAAVALALPRPGAAQQSILTGRVTDVETGQGIDAAQVQVLGGAQSTGGLTDQTGRYRIQVPAGTHSIVVQRIGYREERFDGIEVPSGGTTTYDIQLTSVAVALGGIEVTAASRRAEKQVEAPATTHVVGSTEISERPTVTPTDHLREAPGVDIITHGVQATNVVVRGFNNIFSGALHVLTDHRLAGIPSLRVNLLHFVPANNEDVERMEVVLGPGSALYGPNTANGVLHILTKSPLTSTGTTLSVAAGERNVFQGAFRSAFLVTDDLGFKISGQYMTGTEWRYTDPTEEAARLEAQANPQRCVALLMVRGYDQATATASCQRVGVRDFDLSRYGVEARADWRFTDDGTLVLTYGRTSATGLELTGLGAGLTEDWIYQFYQARLNKGRLFTQAYFNTSDAGDTYLLRDGVPLVDESRLLVGQIQHGLALADGRQDFTYGFDFYHTEPRTDGTINGSYEDEDEVDEWGLYLQSKTALSEQLDFIAAGRVDSHSMLDEDVWSPRAALVFKPVENQSLRLTYNRAFSTPSTLNLFLDISGGVAPDPLGPLGYTVRAYGTGKDGYSFQNPDGSLRGMRSPFNPGGAGQLLPADPAVMWALAVGVLRAQGIIDDALAARLNQFAPAMTDVGIMLLDPNNPTPVPLQPGAIPDVPGLSESYTESVEVGWQGVLGNRIRVAADVYWMRKNDFVSPLILQTPLLLLNGQDVGGIVGPELVPEFTQAYMQAGYDQQTAQQMAQQDVAALVTGIASLPVAVASSDQVQARGADLIATYLNVGDIDLWGADLAFSWFVNDRWTLNGTYSHISDDYFRIASSEPIALNAPKDKGTLSLAYRNAVAGFNAEGRVRFTSEFPAESAGYVGIRCVQRPGDPAGLFDEDCVEAATLVDLMLGYRIPNTRATAQLSVTNLFDSDYRSFVGVPSIGRFAMIRLKYDLN
ncbi:MAG TPA: TonB-dependent receptor [Longimicrobiales bacterium]|nr:TonB-dependent receptor [Longimicrobiales bacterium]